MATAQQVILYTRPSCRLCDEVKSLLETLKPEYSFIIREIDISKDPELEAKFGLIIPVLDFPEGRMLHGAINENQIRAMLMSARIDTMRIAEDKDD